MFQPPQFSGGAVDAGGNTLTVAQSCTVGWAAIELGVSQRSVGRYIQSGLLTRHVPVSALGDVPYTLLSIAEVRELKDARKRAGLG